MDPFSITVGAISLAGATKKAIGGIKRLRALRDAPEELQDLLTELSQFEEVLQAIQATAHPSENANSPLETLLGGAKDHIVQFDSLIEYRLTQAGSSDKVDRLRWIESRKDIDRLRRTLREIRANLNVVVGVRTGTTVQHTLELMRRLHSENQRLDQMAAALACLPQILERVQSTGSAVDGLLSNFPHHTLRPSRSDPQPVPDNTRNSIAQINTSSNDAISRGHLQLQGTYRVTHCRSDCSCECHRASFSWINWSRASVFGRAYLGKRGPSWIRASPHSQSCKVSAISQIQVIYFIPTWFAMKAIYIRYTSSPLHSPEWLIRIARVVDGQSSRAFRSVFKGDFPEFRSAIASGECTPHDMNEGGSSLLKNVIVLKRYEMLAYLIAAGVDVLQPVGVEDNWLGILWQGFVGSVILGPQPPRVDEALPRRDLIPHFPWDEYKVDKGFTLLHEIVCCISGLDLDNAIKSHSEDLNKLDYDGQSPLVYAIRLCNITAIRTLLRRGADPNISNGEPLCAAIKFYRTEKVLITELLLCSGAIVHGSTGDRIAAEWILSCAYGEDTELLAIDKLLIEHGIDINVQDKKGRSLLMKLCETCSIFKTSTGRIEQLVRYGADVEMMDIERHTALHYAIAFQNSRVVEVLIHAGARLDVKTNERDTIAHLAVFSSTLVDLAKAMFEMDLARLDLDLKNEEGDTAYDLLRKRNGPRWENHFKKPYERRRLFPFYTTRVPEPPPEDEYQVILALEALLHHIQDSQGVPKDDQYPPLGEYVSDDKDEEPVPGAWPV